ncbi:cysteate racemase [Siccirubricoccus phaeus]|uniref:aspartate/glutamate racemase family protein n=1 Tax=Siccirubricoccus phaeus TaxID=2595053 RepID=UPI0011F2F36E|nr:amino acid racemase [Siccirubricoccus phaeus]
MDKVLGVLGGMGPLASAHFMVRLTLLTPVERDQEHLPTVLWSDPRVPDRTAARLRGGQDPLPVLLRGVRGLEAAGAGAIAIPCNTAHGWYAQMQAATTLPILHIVDAAAAELRRLGVPDGPIGVMGTAATLAMRLYQERLAGLGYDCLVPDAGEMASRVTPAIALVKAGRVAEAYAPLAEVASALVARGARAVVLGCTEIPLGIAAGPALPFPVADTIDGLARASLRWAGYGG